jgi:hypothetical protein
MGGAFPVTFNGVSSSGSIGSAYNGQFINVTGSSTTQTLVAASTVTGMTVGFITSASFTLDSAGGNIYGASISTTSIFVPVGGFICIQSDGANWRIFSSSLASGFPSSSPSISASGSIGIAYANAFVNVGGSATTQTLAAASTVSNMAVGFIADSTFTLDSASGNIYGPNLNGTSLNVKAGNYICLQSDGTNWRVFSTSIAIPAFSTSFTQPTASRAVGTVYTNSTGLPMFVSIIGGTIGTFTNTTLNVNGVRVNEQGTPNNGTAVGVSGIVPPGATYECTADSSGINLNVWTEIY